MSRCARSLPLVALVVALCLVPGAAGAAPPATDGPGALSHFDLARKDCVGTARNTTSKVWFTVANGVLSDVYFPTNDNTNVETLQYVVTDGSSFTDLQTRNTTYTVAADRRPRADLPRSPPRPRAGATRSSPTTSTDPAARPCSCARSFVRAQGPAVGLPPVRRATTRRSTATAAAATGNGGADDGAARATPAATPLLVGSDTVTADQRGQPRLRACRCTRALDVDRGFDQATNGFAGAAERRPRAARRRATRSPHLHDSALQRQPRADRRACRSAITGGFTSHSATATTQAGAHLGHPALTPARLRPRAPRLRPHLERLRRRAWSSRAGRAASRPRHWSAILDEYYLSANYVKAAEDKTFPGAVAASLTSPWGQAVSAGDPASTYFGSSREVFARDLYEAWTALLACR